MANTIILAANTSIIQLKQNKTLVTQTTGSATADSIARLDAAAAFAKANIANTLAQSAYDFANTISGGSAIDAVGRTSANAAFAKANVANVTAEAAFSKANSSNVIAQAAYDAANAAGSSVLTQAAFAKANTANVTAEAAYSKANSASSLAQASYDVANAAGSSVLTQAAFAKANVANVTAETAFAKANVANTIAQGSYDKANTANVTAEAAYAKANAANVLSQAAFDNSNTKFSTSGGTVSGDVTVSGNLTVIGTTVYANTETVLIKDNIITLNAAISQSGTPASNAGIEIDRGASSNSYLLWDETGDRWVFSNDGVTYYPIADGDRLESAFSQANSAFTRANTSNLTISLIDAVGNISNVVSNVTTLRFDSDSGFDVNSLSQGIVKVGMNSTFKYWKINGVTYLTAEGIDTINFLPTNGITITANGNSSPQSIQFDGSIIFDKANAANVLAQASFDKANSANDLAQASFDKANTDATSISATAGVYGNATFVPVITLSANGRISSITNTAISAGSSVANAITLGASTDGSLSNVGAYTGWTTATYVTDAIDDLNEMMDNVRANTFVKSVTFTASPAAAGSGSTITLTLVPVTANGTIRYDINWGDASFSNNATGLTQTHVYTAQGSKTITVRAYNASGAGTGSEASNSSAGIVVIYTADPTMGYSFYRSLTGGTALVAGSTMYVTEGETFYLQNDTTNTTGSAVTYIANFGDNTANTSIASDTAAGGVFGARLPYTYGFTKSSGTSSNTINLVLTSSNTANPSSIPRSISSVSMKIYDANIAPPANLSTKTITFAGTVGTSPFLCVGFANNTGGATTYTAGNSVNRTVATSGNIATVTMTSIAYNANNGTLSAYVNGADLGNKVLTTGSNIGTNNSLTIVSESDYQLFDSNGTATTFALSTYSPSYFRGFTANISTAASAIGVGVNNFQLRHSANGNTNIVEFVKDDVTSAAITTAGTLSVGTANYRYISGIPYLNTSATIIMTGATVNNWIGQTYTSTATPIQIVAGTLAESQTSMAITNTNFTYAQANGASNFLTTVNGVAVPNANTGKISPYTLNALTVPVATGIKTVQQIGIRANNVFGTGTVVENSTKLAVQSAAQSANTLTLGINEISILVKDITGTHTDNGIRSAALLSATSNTPAYTNTTNFFTTTTYSEASDPGVAGTKEATVRLGVLKYDVTNYSTGYLPVGPNRSGDTGIQYFTFAWRRTGVSSFDINLTSATGITGCWIALPGTVIDASSAYNGWLRCDTTKAGAGYPGSLGGGNGNDGCASTDADRIISGTALTGGYTMSFGTVNSSSAGSSGNVILVRIALSSGQSVSVLGIGAAT